MITLYTIQLSQWRKAKQQNIVVLNTTVKSGDIVFAPSWDIVMAIKRGEIDEGTYTSEYKALMQESFKKHKEHWKMTLLSNDKLAIACYCSKGVFCHRHLLLDMFVKCCNYFGIEYELGGEL